MLRAVRESPRHRVSRIVEVHQHVFAGLDAAFVQARCKPQRLVTKLLVVHACRSPANGSLTRNGMIGARLGAHVDEPIDVTAGKGIDAAAAFVGGSEGHGRDLVNF